MKIQGTKLSFIKEIEPKESKTGKKYRMGLFKCQCGKELIKRISVKSGKYTKSCNKCKDNFHAKTHGKSKHPLYRKWQDMKNRCYNDSVDRYNNYGGRGIKVCDEWVNNFESFYNWCLNNGWEKGLSLDRINVDDNYDPENCRFISMRKQHFNKSNTFYVEINNQSVSLKELLYLNKKDSAYKSIWLGINTGKRSMNYYIDKHNLKTHFEFVSV